MMKHKKLFLGGIIAVLLPLLDMELSVRLGLNKKIWYRFLELVIILPVWVHALLLFRNKKEKTGDE